MTLELVDDSEQRPEVPLGEHCPIERTLGIIGNRVSLVLVREVAYGTHRFDTLSKRAGVSESVTAARLRELVEAGVLDKRPYREPGSRVRHEYVLTSSGKELVPLLIGLMAWGKRHTEGGGPRSGHVGDCDASLGIGIVCEAGHRVRPSQVKVDLTTWERA